MVPAAVCRMLSRRQHCPRAGPLPCAHSHLANGRVAHPLPQPACGVGGGRNLAAHELHGRARQLPHRRGTRPARSHLVRGVCAADAGRTAHARRLAAPWIGKPDCPQRRIDQSRASKRVAQRHCMCRVLLDSIAALLALGLSAPGRHLPPPHVFDASVCAVVRPRCGDRPFAAAACSTDSFNRGRCQPCGRGYATARHPHRH
mmetsp:Transcript_124/g.468  ORF Transcript_124/g.468 Transcript_124/m.468 type:complete len:202 (+) Transcript_124:473-1078(+)